MNTDDFTGAGQLIERLTEQVGDRELALKILEKRGHVYPNTDMLTEEGLLRDNMTAEERALDRAAKQTNKSPDKFLYDPTTNKTKLK